MPIMIPPAIGGAIGVAGYRAAALYTMRYVSASKGFRMLGGEAAFVAGYTTVAARNLAVRRAERRRQRTR